MTVHVRWPAKNSEPVPIISGSICFWLPFLCFFLLGKQKKEKGMNGGMKRDGRREQYREEDFFDGGVGME